MSNDEVERAIGFLLESQAALTASQATLAAKVEANTDAIAALTSKVDGNADAIATLTVKVDATTESVATLAGVANTALDLATKTGEAVVALANAQAQANAQTNGQLARLATMLDRHVSTGH
jgi:hypothetical protein